MTRLGSLLKNQAHSFGSSGQGAGFKWMGGTASAGTLTPRSERQLRIITSVRLDMQVLTEPRSTFAANVSRSIEIATSQPAGHPVQSPTNFNNIEEQLGMCTGVLVPRSLV